MKLFYGWVIVGAGIVVTCIGVGAMLSLAIFLQPMSEAMGWSRTGISTAALLNWLSMGVGSFLWGALSDRFGTRAVVLLGGVLLGLGLVTASQAASLGQFQLVFGLIVGLAAGSFYTPMTATTSRWFTRNRSLAVALVSAGLSAGSAIMAPLARWLITSYDWRTAMLVIGDLVWLVVIPAALLVRDPPATARAGAPHAAVRRHRAHVLRVLRCTLGSDLPHGHPRDRSRRAGDGRRHRVQRRGPGLPERQDRLRARGRPRRREAHAGRGAGPPGGRREPVRLHPRPPELLRARGDVRLRLRRRDAALRHPRARVFRRPDHGHHLRRGRLRVDAGHGARALGRRLALRCVR